MGRVRSEVRWAASLALLVAVFIGGHWCYQQTRGVEVLVHNADHRALSSVVVLVTGQVYELGELAPDATGTVFVRPTGDSGVSVSFDDPEGHPKRLDAGGYLERSYTGTITIDVTADSIRSRAEHVEPSMVPHCVAYPSKTGVLATLTPGRRTR